MKTVQYQTMDAWLKEGNKITVVSPYLSKIRSQFGHVKSKSKNKRKGIGK